MNVREVIPFLGVAEMERSLLFYLDGLGFTMKERWLVEGRVRWCRLQLGGASIMLQEFSRGDHGPGRPEGALGQGVSLEFVCEDALAVYRESRARGLAPAEPFVGNGMWVTALRDPDGYRLEFESATGAPEETRFSALSPGA